MVLISFMTLKAFAFAILMKNIKSEKESQLLGTDTKKKKKNRYHRYKNGSRGMMLNAERQRYENCELTLFTITASGHTRPNEAVAGKLLSV